MNSKWEKRSEAKTKDRCVVYSYQEEITCLKQSLIKKGLLIPIKSIPDHFSFLVIKDWCFSFWAFHFGPKTKKRVKFQVLVNYFNFCWTSMTTAHRPTWHTAIGGSEQGGNRTVVPTRAFSAKDLPGYLTLKTRPSKKQETLEGFRESLRKKEHKSLDSSSNLDESGFDIRNSHSSILF